MENALIVIAFIAIFWTAVFWIKNYFESKRSNKKVDGSKPWFNNPDLPSVDDNEPKK